MSEGRKHERRLSTQSRTRRGHGRRLHPRVGQNLHRPHSNSSQCPRTSPKNSFAAPEAQMELSACYFPFDNSKVLFFEPQKRQIWGHGSGAVTPTFSYSLCWRDGRFRRRHLGFRQPDLASLEPQQGACEPRWLLSPPSRLKSAFQ